MLHHAELERFGRPLALPGLYHAKSASSWRKAGLNLAGEVL